jgi:hypothetical protein
MTIPQQRAGILSESSVAIVNHCLTHSGHHGFLHLRHGVEYGPVIVSQHDWQTIGMLGFAFLRAGWCVIASSMVIKVEDMSGPATG